MYFSFVLSLALLPPPKFPNCSSPWESALVYADYLRSRFSVSQPKALRSRARGYLFELRRATCSQEFHSCLCSFFFPAEFFVVSTNLFSFIATNLSLFIATGPDKVAYSMLKHLTLTWIFCYTLSIFYGFCIAFLPSERWNENPSSFIPTYKMGKPLDSSASFLPMSFTCVSKLFEPIIQSRVMFFLESNFTLSSRQACFRPEQSTLNQILFLSQSISDGLNEPKPGSPTILTTINFSKAFDSVWHPILFLKLILLTSLLALLIGLKPFLSDMFGFSKSQK